MQLSRRPVNLIRNVIVVSVAERWIYYITDVAEYGRELRPYIMAASLSGQWPLDPASEGS